MLAPDESLVVFIVERHAGRSGHGRHRRRPADRHRGHGKRRARHRVRRAGDRRRRRRGRRDHRDRELAGDLRGRPDAHDAHQDPDRARSVRRQQPGPGRGDHLHGDDDARGLRHDHGRPDRRRDSREHDLRRGQPAASTASLALTDAADTDAGRVHRQRDRGESGLRHGARHPHRGHSRSGSIEEVRDHESSSHSPRARSRRACCSPLRRRLPRRTRSSSATRSSRRSTSRTPTAPRTASGFPRPRSCPAPK